MSAGDVVTITHPSGGDQRREVAKVDRVIPLNINRPLLIVAGRLFAWIRGEYVGETAEGSPLTLTVTS